MFAVVVVNVGIVLMRSIAVSYYNHTRWTTYVCMHNFISKCIAIAIFRLGCSLKSHLCILLFI